MLETNKQSAETVVFDDPFDMRPITLTIYLAASSDEDPHDWNVSEWLNDPTIVGWTVADGHVGCDCDC